jgi:hypothetical protein
MPHQINRASVRGLARIDHALQSGTKLPLSRRRKKVKTRLAWRLALPAMYIRACIDHKSLPNSTQLHGYNQGFVISAG